jgi:integrase
MPRPKSVQITRDPRKDGSITFGLRVRANGADERVPLGNSDEGWDETRVETARKQLLAKIELDLWTPGERTSTSTALGGEPTFRELATDWLADRKRNPGIRPRTRELNESQLTRYLLPFFGDLRPSRITPQTIKDYRRRIHEENEQIRGAAQNGNPLVNPRTKQRLKTLGNESINKTLQTLARILDEAEDGDWIDRNPARGRRMREPRERRRRPGALDLDEFLSLLEAASELDNTRHSPRTLERAHTVRALRDHARLEWKAIAKRLKVATSTAHYLYSCRDYEGDSLVVGRRRAVIMTLGLAGPRVSELCELDNQDVDLAKTRLVVKDSKTEAGVRDIDIHRRLLSELRIYRAQLLTGEMNDPAFPTRSGTRRTKDNVGSRVVATVVKRANEIRASRKQPPIHVHVTPHTFRRTYATYMLAAGHDVPYVQHQLGHVDPTITLAIYTQLMRRADREELRQELRDFIETPVSEITPTTPVAGSRAVSADGPVTQTPGPIDGLRRIEKAGKGRTITP